MRTAIFIGLITIAEAINPEVMREEAFYHLGIIFFCLGFDLLYFFVDRDKKN
jgi:hypothetical protein